MTMLFDSSLSQSANKMSTVFHVKWKWRFMVALISMSQIECETVHLISSSHCPFNKNHLLCHWFSPLCINKFGIFVLSL